MATPYVDDPVPKTVPVVRHTDDLTLAFRDEARYLLVTARGPWDPGAIQRAIDTVRREAASRGYARVLIDAWHLEPARYGHHKYSAAKQIAEMWGRSMRVVFLRPPEFQDGLIENTANNRGAQVAVLSDRDEGLAWLLQGETPHQGAAREEDRNQAGFLGPIWNPC